MGYKTRTLKNPLIGTLKLSKILKKYRWARFGEFGFKDEDALQSELIGKRMIMRGIPDSERFKFSFFRVPKKGSRLTIVYLCFDRNGIYTGIKTRSSLASKTEIKGWEIEAISYLATNGYIEDVK